MDTFVVMIGQQKVSMDTFAVRIGRSKYPCILLPALKSYLIVGLYNIFAVAAEKADERRMKVHAGARHRESKRALK